MKSNPISKPLAALHLTMLAGAMLGSTAVFAASQCKGMQQDSCASADQCVWVNGYARKDGRMVTSHCKTRPGKKAADQAALESLKLSRTR